MENLKSQTQAAEPGTMHKIIHVVTIILITLINALRTSHQLLEMMHKVQVVKSKGHNWGHETREIENQAGLKKF